jgi:hypothetical protein
MRFVSNKEITEQEDLENGMLRDAEDEAEQEGNSLAQQSIAAYIKSCFDSAKRFKENGVESQIVSNMKQVDGQYDPDKLAAIKEMGGAEVFMMITDAKAKNAGYWIQDILFQPGTRPWGIEPTPVPDLPDYVMEEAGQQVFSTIMMQIEQEMSATGVPPDINYIQQQITARAPEIQDAVKAEILTVAKEKGKNTEVEIDDKLIEGGWYEALRKAIPNIIMHTGFIKGPVVKKRKVLKIVTGPDHKVQPVMTEELYPTWESRHPLYIYPAPGSTGIDDGYLIDRVKITPMSLQDLLGVPGYSDLEIMNVLEEVRGYKLSEWLAIDQDIADMNKEQSPIFYDSDKIDMLEYWGAVQGEMLTEWGMKEDQYSEPLNQYMFYQVKAYLIGSHVIGVQFNDDPLGRKPFYKDSFEDKDGSFWGKGLPQIIADCQGICNAMARAIVNSAAMGSGPQVERNVDRIPTYAREDKKLTPWKVWDTTTDMMSTGPAMQFYQPPMVVEKLLRVYDKFSKVADEHSGVPAYAHGDSQVGGGGDTASGLSMLMGAAARGIRGLVTSIDQNITKPSVERQFLYAISTSDNYGLICDYQIVTAGSSAALVKEQLAARRIEFMNNTANPIDMQILGMEGRKYLLEETARSIQLDLRKVFPPGKPQPAPAPMGAEAGEGAQTLDAAGNPVVGQDTRMYNKPSTQTTGG